MWLDIFSDVRYFHYAIFCLVVYRAMRHEGEERATVAIVAIL
jgi:hypothetical protein